MDRFQEIKPIWRLTGLFFGLMVVFTLLSRAVYQRGVAVVTTAVPGQNVITHSIRVTGKAVQNGELPVVTQSGIRVAEVLVQEGEHVKKDQVLLKLDLDDLGAEVLYQEQELEKQKLSIQDIWTGNSVYIMGQITCKQIKAELETLRTLKEAAGEIRSPAEGIVLERRIRTGEKTTDEAVLLMADIDRGCHFSGILTEEQRKYIGLGDQVMIRSQGSGKIYKDLPVTFLSADGIGVELPESSLQLGEQGELTFSRRSQPYACCIPVSALRLDERNEAYVLVIREIDTVLGKQAQAAKVSVTVLDKSDKLAAIEGSLGGQRVIATADRAVEVGSRVRVDG